MQSCNVLMTGGGAPGAPGIIKCLLQANWINLLVGDADKEATGCYLHPNFIELPKANEERFADAVLSVCKEHDIKVILPLVTKELLPLAKAKESFAQKGINVLVSPMEAIEIANNKAYCYQFLHSQGIA